MGKFKDAYLKAKADILTKRERKALSLSHAGVAYAFLNSTNRNEVNELMARGWQVFAFTGRSYGAPERFTMAIDRRMLEERFK